MIIQPYSTFDWEQEALQHQRTVYVDIDDTLLLHDDFRRPPVVNRELVRKLCKLKSQGCQIVLWSGNAIGKPGAESRRHQVDQLFVNQILGLLAYDLFDAVLAKPHVILDDHADWFNNTHLIDVTK